MRFFDENSKISSSSNHYVQLRKDVWRMGERKFQKAISMIVMMLICVLMNQSNVKAANTVTIHVKDEAKLRQIFAYAWDDNGEPLGEWPGSECEKEDDDWYKVTLENVCDTFNIIFSRDTNSDGEEEFKTDDIVDVSASEGEYWVVLASQDDPKFNVRASFFVTKPSDDEVNESTGEINHPNDIVAYIVIVIIIVALFFDRFVVRKRKAQKTQGQ